MNRVVISSVLVLTLIACGQKESPTDAPLSSPSPATLEPADLRDLKEQVSTLEKKVFMLEASKDAHTTAEFNPTGNKGYQRVDGNVGYFLVSLENVEPYLDGQKVTLLIGNPNNVVFNGFKLKVKWGLRFPKLDDSTEPKSLQEALSAYASSTQEKEIKLTDTLKPGNWNKVSFTIAPAKADAFGRLEIGIVTDQVRLSSSIGPS